MLRIGSWEALVLREVGRLLYCGPLAWDCFGIAPAPEQLGRRGPRSCRRWDSVRHRRCDLVEHRRATQALGLWPPRRLCCSHGSLFPSQSLERTAQCSERVGGLQAATLSLRLRGAFCGPLPLLPYSGAGALRRSPFSSSGDILPVPVKCHCYCRWTPGTDAVASRARVQLTSAASEILPVGWLGFGLLFARQCRIALANNPVL